MERYGLTADQAMQTLAQATMQTDAKIRHIADDLVRNGEFPRG
jgi:AmiR/NasT family two-component response regulator